MLSKEQKEAVAEEMKRKAKERKNELAFVNHIVPFVRELNVLKESIHWISSHLKPEDVFSENKIIDAYNRITKEKDVQLV